MEVYQEEERERPLLLVLRHRTARLPKLGCASQTSNLGQGVGLWISIRWK